MSALQRYSWIWILFAVLILAAGCQDSTDPDGQYNYIPADDPGDWETAPLAEVGMRPAPLVDMLEELHRRDDHYMHAVLIVKNGKLVFEVYFPGRDFAPPGSGLGYVDRDFDRHTLHYQASVSKSFTSALMGIAVDQNAIAGVGVKLFDFFPEHEDLMTPEKELITLEDALAMASGIPWDESSFPYSDPRNDVYQLFARSDPVRFVLEKPLEATPGIHFDYNSGTTCVLGEVVRKQAETPYRSFAELYLFAPLEISDYQCEMLTPQVAFASGGLYFRPRDMAKFGQLYLQNGVWNGEQVISQEWVEASVGETIAVPAAENPFPGLVSGYGYQWWRGAFPRGNTPFYFAAGWGGQYIIVFPSLEMVVVITGGSYETGDGGMFYRMVNDHILPAAL